MHRHVDTVADELAIRQLVARYCDGVNQHDEHVWAAVWAEDGAHWDVAGHIFDGRAAIVAHWREAMASFRTMFQVATTGTVDLDGDRATGRWYVIERNVRRDDTVAELWAWYDDRYVRSSDGWRIQSRVLHIADASRSPH